MSIALGNPLRSTIRSPPPATTRVPLLQGIKSPPPFPHHMVPGHQYPVPPGQKTIAHLFNDAGYHTGYFGKWHLDGFNEKDGRAAFHIIPPERRGGFQTWIGYENNNSPGIHGFTAVKEETAFTIVSRVMKRMRLPLLKYIHDRKTEQGTSTAKPFFAVLSVEPTHNPYIAPPQYMTRYNAEQIQLRPNVPLHANVPTRGHAAIERMTVSDALGKN